MSIAIGPSSRMLQRRGRAFRVADVVLVLAAGAVMWWAPYALVSSWFASGAQHIHRVHDIGVGVLITGTILAALVAEIVHAERKIAGLHQLIVGALAFAIGGAISNNGIAWFGAALLVPIALLWLLHPARGEFLARPEPVSKPLAILAFGYAVPLCWYASNVASFQRHGSPLDPHVKQGHWATMAAMAIGIVLLMLLAAMRTHGWRLPAWCAGVSLSLTGAASVLYHHYAGSFGSFWGTAALVAGAFYILAAEKQYAVDSGRFGDPYSSAGKQMPNV
jgi:MFS family permease